MKTIIHATAILLAFFTFNGQAQGYESTEIDNIHGRTLNVGAGSGFLNYAQQPIVFGSINYEFGLGREVTLAPFAALYTYSDHYYWGNELNPHKLYGYREFAIPVGLRANYYFDNVFDLVDRWDIYAGGAAGYVFANIKWDDAGYAGAKMAPAHAKPLFMAAHAGTRYHITDRIGVFADVSTVWTGALGLSVKF